MQSGFAVFKHVRFYSFVFVSCHRSNFNRKTENKGGYITKKKKKKKKKRGGSFDFARPPR